jgi:hypothetical protein
MSARGSALALVLVTAPALGALGALATLATLGGCKSHDHEVFVPAGAADPAGGGGLMGSGGVAEPNVGDPGADGDRTLAFVITKVIAKQQPTAAAPWHAAGGTWTYFEAHVEGDDDATFAALVPALGDAMFSKMQLVPTTAAAGARVVAAFATQFHVELPPVSAGGKLAPLQLPMAVLGVNSGHDSGFSGEGTWTAAKWFCSTDTVDSAELFFNYSLADRRGELSEKDADYDADIATCLAIALRDGAPPPRTPANDPTLAVAGPELVMGKKIGSRRAEAIAVTEARVLVIDDDGTHGTLASVDPITGAVTQLYATTDRIETGACDKAVRVCGLKLSTPVESRDEFGGDDKASAAVLAGTSVTLLPAIAQPRSVDVSPDGAWIAGETDHELVAIQRETKRTVRVALPEKAYGHIYGWHDAGGHTIAQVVVGTFDPDTRNANTWDLDAPPPSALVASAAPPPPEDADDVDPVSPGHKRRAEFTDGKLVVTPLAGGGAPRTLVFHPSDAHYAIAGCCQWVDDRYLAFPARGFAFIDTDAMKVHFVAHEHPSVGGDDDEQAVKIAPGTSLAVVHRADGLYLASVAGIGSGAADGAHATQSGRKTAR